MLPSPCGLRPQGRAATAPQWPLTCTIENQFVHKFFRISCKFHKYLDTILKNLEMFRNAATNPGESIRNPLVEMNLIIHQHPYRCWF